MLRIHAQHRRLVISKILKSKMYQALWSHILVPNKDEIRSQSLVLPKLQIILKCIHLMPDEFESLIILYFVDKC